MQSPIVFKDLVLIGGGHAHVHTIKMFGMNPLPGVRVTLITRDIETPYSGMLPGHIAGIYTRDECHIDLGRLCSFAGVRLLNVEANGLNTDEKLIFCGDGRPPISYDVVSVDIGITPKQLSMNFKNSDNITPVKPIDGFGRRWEIILSRCLSLPSSFVLRIAVIGGGGGGMELCFAMHHRIRKELSAAGKNPDNLQLCVFNRGQSLMSSHSK